MLHDLNYITTTILFYTWRYIHTYEKLYEIKQAPVNGAFLMPGSLLIRAFIHLYGCYLLPGYMGPIRVYTGMFSAPVIAAIIAAKTPDTF